MKLISAETIYKHTQTSGERNEIDEILEPILLVQRIYGTQVLNPNWSWRNNALILMCSVLLVTYVDVGTFVFMQKIDDVQLFAEAIFTLIINFEFPIKVLFFIHYRSAFREVYINAKTSLFSIVQEISPGRGTHLIGLLRKMVKVVYFLAIGPVLSYLLIALWFYFNGTRVTLSSTTSILMPMTSPTYEVGLLLHLYYLFMVSYLLIVIDFWFVFLTFSLCEACDCAVKILQVNRFEGENDITYANRLNEALGKFYTVHVKLMEYLDMLNVMYKWPILVPMGAVLAVTCVFLLVMSEGVNLQLISVMLPALVESFAYNVLGERIKSKANDMNMALLNFDWTSMRLKDKKSYHIIVSYMIKDFGICSAIGMDLSLLTLSSIYKGSYQTFAVLNTMKK